MTRRPYGEAAELILKAVGQAKQDALSFPDLVVHTGLPTPTLRDNVKALRKAGKLKTRKDERGKVWVGLP